MADILQMSYSEMESLAAAFESASDQLNQMEKEANALMIQVGQMTNQDWVKATNEAVQKTKDTARPLNQIMESVEGVWQGERYQDFSCNIYPSIEKSLNDVSQEFTAFLETLRELNDTALLEMGRILRIILTQSIECNKTAVWIQNYTVQHMCAEKGIDSDKMNDVLGMSADQKRRWIHANTSYPDSVIQNVGDDVTKRNQSFMSFDEADAYMEKNDRMVNGETSIYNLHTTKNDDGSGEISFICANSTRRSTEITVYDENGNVVRQENMDGCYDSKEDELRIMSNQTYSAHIPQHGYIKIAEYAPAINKDHQFVTGTVEELNMIGPDGTSYGPGGLEKAGIEVFVGDNPIQDHPLFKEDHRVMAAIEKELNTRMGPGGVLRKDIKSFLKTDYTFKASEAENSNGDGALYFYVG